MRVAIALDATLAVAPSTKAPLALLRLTPAEFDAQHVLSWRIEHDDGCWLRSSDDAFGNVVHILAADGPVERMAISVRGEIEVLDVAGVVRGAREGLPPAAFLRETPATAPDPALRAFAVAVDADADSALSELHALMAALTARVSFDPAAEIVGAGQAFAERAASAADHAHMMICTARALGHPSRFVSGYRCDGQAAETSGLHSWAEVHVAGYGWIGFDSAFDTCPTDSYVRVAVALDHIGAAPVAGARLDINGEPSSTVRRADLPFQSQSQRQGGA